MSLWFSGKMDSFTHSSNIGILEVSMNGKTTANPFLNIILPAIYANNWKIFQSVAWSQQAWVCTPYLRLHSLENMNAHFFFCLRFQYDSTWPEQKKNGLVTGENNEIWGAAHKLSIAQHVHLMFIRPSRHHFLTFEVQNKHNCFSVECTLSNYFRNDSMLCLCHLRVFEKMSTLICFHQRKS